MLTFVDAFSDILVSAKDAYQRGGVFFIAQKRAILLAEKGRIYSVAAPRVCQNLPRKAVISVLNRKQHEAIVLLVTTDMTQVDIAARIGVDQATLSKWKRRDEFIEGIRAEQRRYLSGLTAKAIRTMEKLLKAKSESVRFNASADILNRTGFKPEDRSKVDISSEGVVISITGAEDDQP